MSHLFPPFIALFAFGCAVDSTPPAPSVSPMPTVQSSVNLPALIRAKQAMKTLGTTLKGELVTTLKADGPMAALQVCAQDAESLTARVAAQTGVRVGRSSTRLRNPKNAGPEWVTTWLKQQGERAAKGVQPHVSSATTADGGAVVRVIAPLVIEPPCLICHGPASSRPKPLSDALAAKYPTDAAHGYALGDLRGAIWAEAPVINTGLHLELNGNAKWTLDESTRITVGEIRTLLNASAPTDLADAHALAAAIDGVTSRMIEGCSMTGESHDQLHLFLQALFPAISELKKASTYPDAVAARSSIQTLIAEFDPFFE